MATQNSYQMHLQVNLRHLRLFTLVAETGTTRAAALQAGLTQPAVTQGIARLEEQFNCELFQRSRAGMQINSSGKIIYIRAKRMIELLGEILRRADTLRRGKTRSSIERTVTTAQLQVVIAVARAHGFSAAARQMDIAEPTVHRTAREFEKLVGVKLFQRVSHGIEMTPAGLDIAKFANLALYEIAAAFEEIAESKGAHRGRISVGSLPLARTDILPQAIANLCAQEPYTSVEIVEASYETLLHSLKNGDLDIIVSALREDAALPEITEEKLFEDELAIITRVGHPLLKKSTVTIEDLAAFPWIVPRHGSPTRDHFHTLFSGVDLKYGLIESASLIILRTLLTKSDRLTLMSRRRELYEDQQGLLVSLPMALPFTQRPIGISTRRNWQPTHLQRVFIELLRDTAQTD